MKSSQIMIVTAMLLAAAFAGIVLMDEESDAVAVDDITAVSYTDGTNSRTTAPSISDGALTLMDVEDAFGTGIGKELRYWVSNSGISYDPANPVQVANINVNDVVNGTFVLTAVYEITTIPFIVDGETVGEATPESDKVTIPEEATDAVAEKIADGDCIFLGWIYSGDSGSTPIYYDTVASDGKTAIADKTVAIGQSFTAVFQEVYTAYWVVDGTIIANGEAPSYGQPTDPDKENYTFVGWAINGEVVIEKGEKITESEYEVIADTTFTAVFEADLITVTFVAGNETVGTVEVRYGNTVNALALPSGYMAWAIDAEGTAAFDFTQPITAAITIYAVEAPIDESYYVTFNIEGMNYGPYQVNDRFSIPNTDRDGYIFAGWVVEGGDGTKLTNEQVNSYEYAGDVTFIATYDPAPAPEGPGFFQTTAGQAVLVILFFAILAFVACYVMNYGGLRDKLSGIRIVRVKKE